MQIFITSMQSSSHINWYFIKDFWKKKIIMDFHEDFEGSYLIRPYLTKTKAQNNQFLYKPLKIVS